MTIDPPQLATLVRRVRSRFGVPAVAVTALNAEGVTAECIDGERVLGRGDPATPDGFFHIDSFAKSGVTPSGPEHPYRIPELLVPAGDLSMTPRGFAAYVREHLRGLGGVDGHLTSASYRRIHFGRKGFSLGVANGVLGGRRYSGLDGSAGTIFCRAVLVPDEDSALTVMTNAGSGSGSMRAVDGPTLAIVKRRFGWWWRFWL